MQTGAHLNLRGAACFAIWQALDNRLPSCLPAGNVALLSLKTGQLLLVALKFEGSAASKIQVHSMLGICKSDRQAMAQVVGVGDAPQHAWL